MSAIGDVLEHYGAQVPPGNKKMRCPFHEDAQPSAIVNHTANRFHCFVCGIHEDPIGIVRLREGGSFADAKRVAAEIAGTGVQQVPERSDFGGLFPERSRGKSGNSRAVASWRSQFA